MRTRTGFLVVLGIALAGLLGYILYHSIEMYEETITKGWSNKALRNPLLAAEQYLRSNDFNIDSSNSLNSLDGFSERGVVFVSDSRQIQTQKRVDSLFDWMQKGGHLIVGAEIQNDDGRNLLLQHFGIKKEEVDCECNDTDVDQKEIKLSELLRDANRKIREGSKKGGKTEKDLIEEKIDESKLTKLYFTDVKQPLLIDFKLDVALVHPAFYKQSADIPEGLKPSYWVANQAGVQFVQFLVGDGLLTVLSEGSIWRSSDIAKVDHAYLLSILMDHDKKGLLLYGLQMPSLLSILVSTMPEFMMAAALLLLMWLLHKSRRFGPVRQVEAGTRRSLDEHIIACGELLWHARKGQEIMIDIRDVMLRRIKAENPEFQRLEDREQIDWIGEKCQLTDKEVRRALYDENINSETYFYRAIALIQKIGNKL